MEGSSLALRQAMHFGDRRHNLEISWISQKPFQAFSEVPRNDQVAIS